MRLSQPAAFDSIVATLRLKDPSGLLGPSLYRSVDSNFVTKREDVLLRDRIEELAADMCPSSRRGRCSFHRSQPSPSGWILVLHDP